MRINQIKTIKIIFSILLITLIFNSLSVYSQNTFEDKVLCLDKRIENFKSKMDSISDESFFNVDLYMKYEELLSKVNLELLQLFKEIDHFKINNDCQLNFDRIHKKTFINVITSKDKKLKILSWDTCLGGTAEQYASVAIYQTKEKQFQTILLNDAGLLTKNKIMFDAYYTDINCYIVENETFYILSGEGKCASMCKRIVVNIFQISENGLLLDKPFLCDGYGNYYRFLECHYSLEADKYDEFPKITLMEVNRIIRFPFIDEVTDEIKYKDYFINTTLDN